MTYQVAVIHEGGTIEVLRKGVSAATAESITRHPSLHGFRFIVAPDFCELVAV